MIILGPPATRTAPMEIASQSPTHAFPYPAYAVENHRLMEPSVSSPLADGRQDASLPTPPATGCEAAGWRKGLRELLCWCLPALLIGLALRAALIWSMPFAYVQYDSSDYLITTDHLIENHQFYIHNKRSYLTPALFSAAFLLPAPAAITIEVAQHAMGLIAIVLVGALVRMWFRFWKPVIVPITILFAANPSVIWYEHTIMGEAQYLFFTLIMVFAGTVFALGPSIRRFIWFVVSLLLVFGTRLESKTFLLFAVLLVIPYFWKQWRRMAIGLGTVAAAYLVAFSVSGDRDGSSLIYASLIRFAPTTSRSEPDFMPRILPIQEDARAESRDYPAGMVRVSKLINKAVDEYVAERVKGKRAKSEAEVRIVRNLCLETLKAEPVKTLVTPWTKFHLAIDAWSSYCFDQRSLWQNQAEAFTMKDWMTLVLGHGLTGQSLTLEQVPAWVKAHYDPARVAWFTQLQTVWNEQIIRFRLPDQPMAQARWVHDFYGGVANRTYTLPGVPFFYIVVLVGMIVSFLRPSRLRPFHFAWVATMLGGLYVCSMVGVTNGRFRFVYEPFFFIYIFLLFDCVVDWVKVQRQPRESSGPCST
jgi:hypothetical protein